MFTPNTSTFKVLTPTGYQPFAGVNTVTKPASLVLKFETGESLECSPHHPLLDKNDVPIIACNWLPGEFIKSRTGFVKIESITLKQASIELYDLIDVEGGNVFYSNNVLSHNCKFLSSDPLLIKSSLLQDLKGRPVITEDNGFKFWYNIDPTRSYLVGVDVAEGIGKDYSVIELFDTKTLCQVAEMRSNNLSEALLYDKLKWLLTKLLAVTNQAGSTPEVQWSFENNSCGKVISTLYYNDENFPAKADLITVGAKLGMNTNSATKKEACAAFKKLVEGNKLFEINSEDLITELKNFHQKGSSFEAKSGATDDSVSACLIITRIVMYLATFDDDAFNKLYRGEAPTEQLHNYDEEELPPMPTLL